MNVCGIPVMPIEIAVHAADQYAIENELVIIPDGYVRSSKGNFTLDAEAARAIIAAFKAQRRELVIDYEHQTIGGEFASPDGRAPAAGWIKDLAYEPGKGLVATVHWTARAAEMIRTREYRYLSPVTLVDKKTRRAVGVHSVALTNDPAIVGFPELVAASSRAVRRLIMAEAPEDTGQSVDTLIVNLRELLGLAEDAAPEEVLAAAVELLRSMQASEAEAARALGLKEDADRTTIVAAIGKLKTDTAPKTEVEKLAARNESLGEEVLALKARSVAAETDQVIAKHSAEGKLTAAQAKFWREKLSGDVDRFEHHRQEFEELMAMSQPIVEPGKTVPPNSDAPRGREAVIAKAKSEYDSVPERPSKRCDFVNVALREAGKERLSDEEAKKLSAA